MFTIELFIPLADNDGVRFTPEEFTSFETVLADRFGGYSRLNSTVVGGWAHEGRLYRDDLVVYVVGVSSIADGAKVAEAASFAKAHFRQLAIFVRYLGLSEVL